VGAALYAWNILLKKDRLPTPLTADFGPTVEELSEEECNELRQQGVQVFCEEENNLYSKVADLIMNKKIIIWCRGKMEFGPRALGNRSFIAHPGDAALRDRLNNLKRRASFRPLAPAVLEESFDAYFTGDADYYMNKVAYVRSPQQLAGVAHIDGSARVQLVTSSCPFYPLLKVLDEKYGLPVIINTSLNKKGKPIIRSKGQAIDAFYSLEADAAVIGNTLLIK
jgi:carbamoyltransferase